MVKPIGILYEHPEWFRPPFAELERRGLPYEPIQAQSHRYDPADRSAPYSLVVNRVSPSSYLRKLIETRLLHKPAQPTSQQKGTGVQTPVGA